MRILHILDHSLPMQSGYTFRTRAILKAQEAMGLEVRGITGARHTADGSDEEVVDGLTFHRARVSAPPLPVVGELAEIRGLARGIADLAKTWRPDVLHAHSPALGGMAGVLAARRLGLPLVYEIRAFWEDAAVGNGTGRAGSLRYRSTRRLEDAVVRRADAVVTICDGLRRDLASRGHDPAKTTVMPNGVDLDLFGTPPAPDPSLRTRLGLGGGPVLGFIGSFYDYEGLDDLVAALPAIRAKVPGTQVLLVGGGPRDAALKAQIASLGLEQAVVMPGRVPHAEVEAYYALVDCLVFPRRASRLTDLVTPLKPLEAMAQGRIVTASDVGGHRELIEDGVTGRLFAADDPAALAHAIIATLQDRRSWNAWRDAGRAHVRERHNWAHNAQGYRRIYQSLL